MRSYELCGTDCKARMRRYLFITEEYVPIKYNGVQHCILLLRFLLTTFYNIQGSVGAFSFAIYLYKHDPLIIVRKTYIPL